MMPTRFTASQPVEMTVQDSPAPIQHYLRQPHRLVNALFDPSRTESLGEDCFRLKLRPLAFLALSIQPIVDLKVWADADGTVHVKSIAAEVRGLDSLNHNFKLNLQGQLKPRLIRNLVHLEGRADLEVQVDLPPVLWFTPRPLLEATGNGLLKSVLMTIKQRLSHQLLADYRRWAAAEGRSRPYAQDPLLSPNRATL
ncbi:MAG: DUF1997 domain-containing protein [Leptolyngbyaceae cyanobacterium bins.59]|nr:DUF1997 domain-containing protein [Leptolyngbyaceae cyanobacterium bins.59]